MKNRKSGQTLRGRRTKKNNGPTIEKHDTELLNEYGLGPRTTRSEAMNRKKINAMNMRQLDRLKMLLIRNSSLCNGYPEKIREGLGKNDFAAFSKALALLSDFR